MYYTKQEIENQILDTRATRKKRLDFAKLTTTKTLGYSVLIFYVFISLMPFFWSIFASFKNPHLLSLTGLNPFPKSGKWTTENYSTLFNGAASDYIQGWIGNTVAYSCVSALLNATLNLLGGYALAQIAMKGKRLILSYFLVSILVPSQATFMPTYFIFYKLHIIDPNISPNIFLFAIIFSGMANIILTFMARQFFLTQTPELEQAAEIEGYSKLGVFVRITLRKMLPLFMTQIVLVFMGSWNNYLTFALYSGGDPEKMTINAGILNIARSAVDKEIGYAQMLAMSNISFVPMMFVYLLSLKIQLRGIKGGNK